MSASSQNNQYTKEEINITEITKPYLLKWPWFIICAILSIIVAFLALKFITPVYKIQSTVLIKDAKSNSAPGGAEMSLLQDLSGFGGMKTNSVDNEIEIFKSKKLMQDVVDRLNLQTNVFAKSGLKRIELYKETSPIIIRIINEKKGAIFPKKSLNLQIKGNKLTFSSNELKKDIIGTYGKTVSLPYANIIVTKNSKYDPDNTIDIDDVNELELDITSIDNKISSMQKLLQAELTGKETTVIRLSMNYAQIQKAKDVLNALVIAYNDDAIQDKNSESTKTLAFIEDRIKKLSGELGQVENEKKVLNLAIN